ncbi:MAG: ribonuclease P protein component [Christensenellaceae bacterium]|jgi:ribonuclease P protein component|nr:ribonuclease P protein component [Christensenellaceae bacterium]
MLKQQYRLKKRKAFNYIYRHGKSIGSDCLTLVFVSAKMKDTDKRVGFSASKKVGNSVIRHKSVRKMREAVRSLLNNIAPDHNYIFVAKEEIKNKTVLEITKAVEYVLRKGGCFHEN